MEMSITRALSELKLLDKRITKSCNNKFISGFVKGQGIKKGLSEEGVSKELKGNYQSVKDLIERKKEIKNKIVLSNAVTEVKIGLKTMKVAEAIERKTSINLDKLLLQSMKDQYKQHKYTIDNQNYKIEEEVSKLIDKNDKSVDPEMLKQNTEFITSKNTYVEIDPNKLETLIKELEQEIDEFESEVDYVLSTSNTITKITVS